MAIDAAMGCLGDPPAPVGRGVTSPAPARRTREKQIASVLATACDLPRAIFTADFAGSARAGVSALLAAVRAVQAGARRACWSRPPTCASPRRRASSRACSATAPRRSPSADDDVIAEFVDAASVAEEFTYLWRTDVQRTRAGRRRTVLQRPTATGATSAPRSALMLERQRLEPEGDRSAWRSARPTRAPRPTSPSQLGFDPKTQLVAVAAARRSAAPAAAEPLLLLARALDEAAARRADPRRRLRRGRRRRCCSAPPTAIASAPRRDAGRALARGASTPLASYEKYLKFRRLIEVEEVDRRGHQRARVQGAQAGRPPLRQPLPRMRPGAVPDGARLHPLPGAGAPRGRAHRAPRHGVHLHRRPPHRQPRASAADGGDRRRRRRPALPADRRRRRHPDRRAGRASPTAACTRAAATTTTIGRRVPSAKK